VSPERSSEMEYYKAVRLDGTSHYDQKTRWVTGETLEVSDPDPSSHGACGRGIHCSTTLRDAIYYQRGPSRYFRVEPLRILATDSRKARCTGAVVLDELTEHDQDAIAGFRLYEANHPVHPFRVSSCPKIDTHALMEEWASVRASVWDSVRASVWASVRASVGASVWDSVGDSVGDSVWDSVWDSVGASVGAYVGSLFPGIHTWRYTDLDAPWDSLRKLWLGGYVPSFDGTSWRLHSGTDAAIVHTWTPGR